MIKNVKFLAILFAFVMQSTIICAECIDVIPVQLHYRYVPKVKGTHKPTKAPAKYDIPLSVFLDGDNQQLIVTALMDGEYTYCIYNESEETISQGILNCNDGEKYIIDLSLCNCETFTIVFIYNGHTFEGTFDIYDINPVS